MNLTKCTRKAVALLLLMLLCAPAAMADKGMWMLNQLKKENLQRMQELGFKLDPQQLFSLENPSIANAVVIFGGGCTGVTVSDQGLIFTNHHCGYSSIQSQSSVEHDYLRDGFVSQKLSEELPIPGLKVKYLRSIVDVTPQVTAAIRSEKNEMERLRKATAVGDSIAKAYRTSKQVDATVYPFFENNEYYLIIYDVFTDVRMVFAPPTSLGKFGGDTDNWMWPRHTCDFAVFRVYADANNRPADYNASNRPYRPTYFVRPTLQGVGQDDFAMTIGFPGSTDRYLSSWGITNLVKNQNEPRILVRGAKQEVWMKHMKADQATRISYASKYAVSSNYWKNSIGMNKGLKRLNVLANKQRIEKEFTQWVAASAQRQQRYGKVLQTMANAEASMGEAQHDYTILTEALNGMELRPLTLLPADPKKWNAEERYKDFSPTVAAATLPTMLRVVKENVKPERLPFIYNVIDSLYEGNYERYAQHVYTHSVVVTKERMLKAMEKYDALKAAFQSDPAVELVQSFTQAINGTSQEIQKPYFENKQGRRLFFAGLREMWPDTLLPSDANFTMRMSYGSVKGYKPFDATTYDYYTTEDGSFEKQDPDSSEFAVQPEILKLLHNKDFGKYAQNGKLRLCFLTTNDITGGNSGSPVFNKNGNLIGLAFDGNWEAMSGDIEFEPNLQRTICVDVRYILWVIEKWGKCNRLLQEIQIAQ